MNSRTVLVLAMSQSATFTKEGRSISVSFLKQNGKYTRVLAHELN